MKSYRAVLVLMTIVLVLSACAQQPEITIEQAWARPGFKGDNSAAYLVINNATDQGDGLIGASCDIASVTEIHLSKMDAQGTMTMERQDLVGIPAGEEVALEPGGLHVMLMDLVEDLNVGDKFELTLEFQRSGDLVTEVEVKQP